LASFINASLFTPVAFKEFYQDQSKNVVQKLIKWYHWRKWNGGSK